MNSGSPLRPVVVVIVTAALALVGSACGGGGDKSYKEGTPAVTGQVPDCSVAPIDLVKKSLHRDDLTGPVEGKRVDGITCSFSNPRGGIADLHQLQLYSNADSDKFSVIKDGFKRNNNKVSKIKGWGDEAYASTVQFYSPTNNFGVRKGKVAVLITSTSDYPYMRDLMKAVLAKL